MDSTRFNEYFLKLMSMNKSNEPLWLNKWAKSGLVIGACDHKIHVPNFPTIPIALSKCNSLVSCRGE
jgi:hypothetical protein